jgi:hypothetical protein
LHVVSQVVADEERTQLGRRRAHGMARPSAGILDTEPGEKSPYGRVPVPVAEQEPAAARGELQVVAPERARCHERVVPVEENCPEQAPLG